MHYGIFNMSSLKQADMEQLLSEESWGRKTWFAWHPVKLNDKWVWLRRVKREVFCVHMTGITRAQYTALD